MCFPLHFFIPEEHFSLFFEGDFSMVFFLFCIMKAVHGALLRSEINFQRDRVVS